MKSERAKVLIYEGIENIKILDISDYGKWQLRFTMAHAVELAEQEAEEITDLKYRISSLTQWRNITSDASGLASDTDLDEIFRKLPRLVRDKRDGCIELIDYDNVAEWMGDLERKPSLYQWRPINE